VILIETEPRPIAPKAKPAPVGATRYEEILAAAIELFYLKGYSETTLQDIATATGLTKASLYHYIHTKEDILFSIVEIAHNRMRTWRDRTDPDGVPDLQIATIIASHIVGTTSHTRQVRLFYKEYQHLTSPRFEPIITERALYAKAVRDVLARGKEQGMFAEDLDIDIIGVSFLAMLNSMWMWFDPAGSWNAFDLWRNYSVLILRGLGVPKRRLTRLVEEVEKLGYFADWQASTA
jgi:AcrR family transcriptional regulator